MIMEHVSGSTWTAEDFARPERLVQLGAALHALHSVPPPAVAPFDVELLLIRHHERLSAALPGERAQLDAADGSRQSRPARQRDHAAAKTVVHNDLHHSNLIGSDRLYLLDWEYAAVADPLLDLACVLAYYPQCRPLMRMRFWMPPVCRGSHPPKCSLPLRGCSCS